MIDEKVRSAAIARLRQSRPVEEISLALDVPYMVVKEWKDNLTDNDYVHINANINAITDIVHSPVFAEADIQDRIKDKIDQTVLAIAQEVYKTSALGDPVQAKCLEICAGTIIQLYNTFVAKDTSGPVPTKNALFTSLMRD